MRLFGDFAKQSADLGRYGNGSKMKFVANLLVAINNVATAEALLLAERAGLDPKTVVAMVGPGAGGSRMFQMRAPMMVERVYEPATMKVSTWKKDMAIIAEFADEVGCATPLFTLTQPVYTEAMAMGLGDKDTASVFEVLEKTILTAPKPRAVAASVWRSTGACCTPLYCTASSAFRHGPNRESAGRSPVLASAWLSLDHLWYPSDKSSNQTK
jgi:3-hydroxyisobutyrate dehydrogenase/glyoxylate/succinic semialdehyde reductase